MLDKTTRHINLKVKEALHIQKTPANNKLNCDRGHKLLGYCIVTIKKLGGRVSSSRISAVLVL